MATETVPLEATIQGHREILQVSSSHSQHFPLVLGISWLARHNHPSWKDPRKCAAILVKISDVQLCFFYPRDMALIPQAPFPRTGGVIVIFTSSAPVACEIYSMARLAYPPLENIYPAGQAGQDFFPLG